MAKSSLPDADKASEKTEKLPPGMTEAKEDQPAAKSRPPGKRGFIHPKGTSTGRRF